MQDGNADFGNDAADDVGFAERAAVHDEGKKKAFEEGGGLVEGFLEGGIEVDVEFAGLVDVGFDAVEEDGGDEVLSGRGLRGDEDLRGGEDGVGGPGFGTRDGEEGIPRWEGREDFERFRERARLVA